MGLREGSGEPYSTSGPRLPVRPLLLLLALRREAASEALQVLLKLA